MDRCLDVKRHRQRSEVLDATQKSREPAPVPTWLGTSSGHGTRSLWARIMNKNAPTRTVNQTVQTLRLSIVIDNVSSLLARSSVSF